MHSPICEACSVPGTGRYPGWPAGNENSLSWLASVVLLFVPLSLAGRSCELEVTPVSGHGDATSAEQQAETAVAVAGPASEPVIVVTSNDMTGTASTIQLTATSRKVKPGASLMGWSYSHDRGKTWTHGGKVSPPRGIAALWGDPAIDVSKKNSSVLFLSNLAAPSSKLPASGADGPMNAFMAGACVARSLDAGHTFSPYQVLDDAGHFYDGASIACASTGEVHAAFLDVAALQIDVWRAPNDLGMFALMPNPFPGMVIASHPRIRTSPSSGTLYVAAQANDGAIYLTRWLGSAWAPRVRMSDGPAAAYPTVQFASGMSLRTGPQFSFDVGRGSPPREPDAIRMMYTKKAASGRLFVTSSYCAADLSSPTMAPEWGTESGAIKMSGDQFHPNVRFAVANPGATPIWAATFMNRSSGDEIAVLAGGLGYLPDGSRLYLPVRASKVIPVNPDLRGYWGDYDDLQPIVDANGRLVFLRPVTDSSLGSLYRWQFSARHMHVSVVKI